MECFIFEFKKFRVDDGPFLKEDVLTKNLCIHVIYINILVASS